MAIVALIHPPTLTPALWAPLTAVLREAGHEVVVPDYTGELTVAGSWWRRATRASVQAIESVVGGGAATEDDRTGARDYVGVAPGPDVLVTFSSAGLLAPLISASRSPSRVVFLDAEAPAEAGSAPDEALAETAGDGVEVVSLPEGFFEEQVGGTPEWEPATVDYVQLTEEYAGHATTARERGWSVVRADLSHLALVRDAPAVVELLGLDGAPERRG